MNEEHPRITELAGEESRKLIFKYDSSTQLMAVSLVESFSDVPRWSHHKFAGLMDLAYQMVRLEQEVN